MASYPPPFSNDPRAQRRYLRDQARLQRMQMRGLRRSSIVGPMLVIVVGIVFLLVQLGHLPAARLGLWFARWWPLLLVVFGVIRLLEWLFDQRARSNANGVPSPQRTLGLGAGLLLALLVIAGVASNIARNKAGHLLGPDFEINQDNLERFLGDKHESTQAHDEPCPPGSSLTINNAHGNITISGTADDNTLHATADNQIFSRSDSDAAAKARQIGLRIEHTGNQIVVTVPDVEGGRADVNIKLPGGIPVTGTVNHGDIQVHSLRAPVQVTANHGDIELSSITGPVAAHINNAGASLSAHSISGPFAVEGKSLDLTLSDMQGPVSLQGDFFGTTHLERISAPVTFHTSRTDLQFKRLDGELEISPSADLSASQLLGPIVLNTRNRNINLERVSGPLSITNRNGSITISVAEPLAPVTIENRNGDVEVTLPTSAQCNVQAETTNADLENDFGLSLTREGDRPELIGTIGKGGPLVQISTSQADISLHRGSIAPFPPVPPSPPYLTALPADAQDAKREVKEAQKEAQQAQREVQQEARQAQKEAQEAQREAQQEAREAQKEALQAQKEAREAAKQARDAARDDH